jgi:hypothetical protein
MTRNIFNRRSHFPFSFMLIKLAQSPLIRAFSSLSELFYGFRVIIPRNSLLSRRILRPRLSVFIKAHLPLLSDLQFLLSVQRLSLSVQNSCHDCEFALKFCKQNLVESLLGDQIVAVNSVLLAYSVSSIFGLDHNRWCDVHFCEDDSRGGC